jgi:phage replication O-like protein O
MSSCCYKRTKEKMTTDNYTAYPNEIVDTLCRTRIPGEERQVLDVIMRKTYGWHKRNDAISLSQFVGMTGLCKPNVVRSIKGLVQKKIIIVIKNDKANTATYRVNEDISQWKPLSKTISLPKTITSVIQIDNNTLAKAIPTKETKKETNTKESASASPEFLAFWSAYPRKSNKDKALLAWQETEGKRPSMEELLAALRRQAATPQWASDAGTYIPYPDRWLREKRWEDEIQTAGTAAPAVRPPRPRLEAGVKVQANNITYVLDEYGDWRAEGTRGSVPNNMMLTMIANGKAQLLKIKETIH